MSALVLPDRFWRRVVIADCWVWRTPTEEGYGRIRIAGVRKRAHVWAFEAAHGPVPAGLVVDHICRNRACVKPGHLRAVTPRENTMAEGSLAIAKIHSERTHCPQGHEYNQTNTLMTYGRRRCRTCVNAARRAKRAMRRGVA